MSQMVVVSTDPRAVCQEGFQKVESSNTSRSVVTVCSTGSGTAGVSAGAPRIT